MEKGLSRLFGGGKAIRLVQPGQQLQVDLLGPRYDHMVSPAVGIGLRGLGDSGVFFAIGQTEGNQQIFRRPTLDPPPRRRGHGEHTPVKKGNLGFGDFQAQLWVSGFQPVFQRLIDGDHGGKSVEKQQLVFCHGAAPFW